MGEEISRKGAKEERKVAKKNLIYPSRLCVFLRAFARNVLELDCVAKAVTDWQHFGEQLRMVEEVGIEFSQRHC